MNAAPAESSPEGESSWKWVTGGWARSVVAIVFLVTAFYVEEDWRGAAAWKQAQADISAAGESLDPNKFIPPPVTEEENFGALPIFQLEPDPTPGYPGSLSAIGMTQAFVHVFPDHIPSSKDSYQGADHLPYLGNWEKNEPPDLPAIQKQLAGLCRHEFPKAQVSPQATPIEMFGLLCPALADLRAADATHPVCRFDEDYTSQPPMSRSLAGITSPIKLARILSYEERLALMSNQPQVALDDLKVGWKVDSGLRKEPQLIAGLVSVGVEAIQLGVVTEGLAKHAWNDQELMTMDNDLGKIDYLTESQFWVRGDMAVYLGPDVDYLKEHRLRIGESMFGMPPGSTQNDIQYFIFSSIVSLLPDGWFDAFKADDVRFNLLGTLKMVDPVTRRVFPEKEERALRLIQDSKATSYWHDYITHTLSPMLNSVKQFAYAQAQVDEARIACRLERYRLAHGKYPDSLKDLAPIYGADLPNDIMNGQPYHYRLMSDGTYLLYSVGWNQVDDGGLLPPPEYYSNRDAPDWTWGNHPDAKKTK